MDFDALVRRLRSKKFWFSWVMVTLGTLVMAAGYVLFTNPYQIIPGGVYGLGRVLHHLVPSIQTGTFGLMLDVPLMITGIAVFGGTFGAKTIFAALLTPVFMNGMTYFLGEDPADAMTFIGQHLNLSDNILIASIFGGVLIGAGVGMIIKSGATSGGTDIVSMLMVRFAKMKFSSAMFIVETVVVLTGMIILQDWKLPLYSLVAIFVSAKVIDYVLEGATYDKLLFIITDKTEEMRHFIINGIDRSGTFIKSKGMYTGKDKEMIFLVVSRRQITAVQDKIKDVDPDSFVVVVNAYETFGEGFKSFSENNL